MQRNITRYEEQKNRKKVSLNEQKFLAEREKINADKEEEQELEELAKSNKPVFDPENFYNREVLAITVDLVAAHAAREGELAISCRQLQIYRPVSHERHGPFLLISAATRPATAVFSEISKAIGAATDAGMPGRIFFSSL